MCEVILWAKFGLFNSYFLGQVNVIIWAKVTLSLHFFVVSGDFFCSVSFCVLCPTTCQCSKIAIFSKKGAKIVFFSNFSVLSLTLEKSLF